MSTPESISPLRSAEARGQCYGLLAAAYNALPNSEFLVMIAGSDVRTLFGDATREAPTPHEERETLDSGLALVEAFQDRVPDAKQDELLLRLGVDRTRLLRGVKRGYGPPPPYESLYRGSEVQMGEAARGARGFYSELGYPMPGDGNEPPDYIGLELDFMRFLCEEEATEWKSQHEGKACQYRIYETEFLNKHVVEWVPVFCGEMLAHASEDLYRGVAHLTRAFVMLDAAAGQTRGNQEA